MKSEDARSRQDSAIELATDRSVEHPNKPVETVDQQAPDSGENLGNLALQGVLSTKVEHKPESSENLQKIVESFFDKFMLSPYQGNMADNPEKLGHYRDVFSRFVSRHFDLDLIVDESSVGEELRSQTLSEFASILASIDHNVGVYYTEDDVVSLFEIIGGYILDDEVLQDQFQAISLGSGTASFDRAVMSRIKEAASLDDEVVIAITQGDDGEWEIVGPDQYEQTNDFMPLEVIRQDNPDKGGWNKYRFRSPTYTKYPDDLHTEQVAEGWYTSEWYRGPNYWSSQLRNAFEDTVAEATDELASTTKVILYTEGGTFKGTATPKTDIDTTCVVTCDSLDEFERSFQTVNRVFSEQMNKVAFPTKEEELWIYFYDRSSGTMYQRSEMDSYKEVSYLRMHDGKIMHNIRDNEKGVGVTTRDGYLPFKKPEHTKADGSASVLIGVESGEICELPDNAFNIIDKSVRAA